MEKITKTAHQLYWDKDFLEKRIKEQKFELFRLSLKCSHTYWCSEYKGWVPDESTRERELWDSALHVLKRFERQLENINKLK